MKIQTIQETGLSMIHNKAFLDNVFFANFTPMHIFSFKVNLN